MALSLCKKNKIKSNWSENSNILKISFDVVGGGGGGSQPIVALKISVII